MRCFPSCCTFEYVFIYTDIYRAHIDTLSVGTFAFRFKIPFGEKPKRQGITDFLQNRQQQTRSRSNLLYLRMSSSILSVIFVGFRDLDLVSVGLFIGAISHVFGGTQHTFENAFNRKPQHGQNNTRDYILKEMSKNEESMTFFYSNAKICALRKSAEGINYL